MRIVPSSIVDAFYSGDMTGDKRNWARVTCQHAGTDLYALPYNLYASTVFGAKTPPMELPNVKSVQWSRATTQDFATATISFYNTKPMQMGDLPTRDLDQPGYYTFNRGRTQFSSRWGHKVNQWSNMLVPDNILRTYEGYGFDPNSIPELDAHLVSTGVWRIDTVQYTTDGLIAVTCRDIGSILADQLIFPPIVPKNFYPVTFTADTTDDVGFIGPSVDTSTELTSSVTRPASWAGPVDGPHTTTTDVGSNQMEVTWTRPSTADSTGGDTTKGYKVTGYEVAIDGVILPKTYRADQTSALLKAKDGIVNGNVYGISVIAIWQEVLTPKGELHFKTNVEASVRSDFGPLSVARPDTGGSGLPTVTVGSIAINVDEHTELDPGGVAFEYTNAGTYLLVAFKTDLSKQMSYGIVLDGSTSGAHFDTGTDLGNLNTWNFLVYGRSEDGSVIGPGDVYFASEDGGYFGAPAPGESPNPAPKQPTPKVTTTHKGKKKVKSPLKKLRLSLTYLDSSDTPYYGRGAGVEVYGHDAADGFNDDPAYWLSVGNINASAGFAYEWLEGKLNHHTLSEVKFKTVGTHYGVYLSVYSDGQWVQHSDTGIIGYNPNLPESHNHGNIPYAEHQSMGDQDECTITLRAPIPNVTKVRITFHNLQYFDQGPYHYRAAVRWFRAFGLSGSDATQIKTITKKTVNKPVVGGTSGGGSSSETSQTNYTPAHVVPGLGANPGLYEDYTDIIKLFCAWGGFYWPPGAYTINSDGSLNEFSFGAGEYGLPNIDPVLGDVDSGRIWGDMEDTGTAGIAQIPTDVWTQKALMDGISYVRDIIGNIFYIDEDGAVVWRRPNWFAIGNWIGNDAKLGTPVRVTNCIELDERVNLITAQATLSGANVRERIFVSTTDGKTGALAAGYNPNPTGLRRVGGWTDQYFSSVEECQVMADLIALRGLFTYHQDVLTIPGYPAIQVDDQVIPIERITGEGYYHYVTGIDSNNDLEAGGWIYTLNTQWLGNEPFQDWAFDPAGLSAETQTYLDAFDYGDVTTLPAGSV